ncbi:1-deoxy-D-xylulose-5-phosphate synthase [Actinoplanes aureus]|uniref:1-deoxy-D-xylulose-5-phosphate synthase n=1 Tax=Actinoplanes aureus TaxID=2792083 RepID=A0A931C680_9ACTN|nr:1-deoxy-D-xylulose-5-phosphate synthase [Actinoplanes aureus]MBG0560208.1 1-deoxy-D-xylulose-5-phosphate synthase [Actinoplanes aureus]
MATVLSTIREPRDLDGLSPAQLETLAAEIREHLIVGVSAAGGHLGSNLGVVELTIALHRVFESPRDRIVFDVGHQAYVHKLLTGRQDFSMLRRKGGLSGYPARAESPHDIVENQHASTALCWADGLANARDLTGVDGHVVAVIGDGGLTGGMVWEALNNIAAAKDRPLVIVVNDNGRSYQPTIGGLADYLARVRTAPDYEKVLQWGRSVLENTPLFGRQVMAVAHGAKKGLKDVLVPQGMFEDLGLKYIGPIDGHNEADLEAAFERAKGFPGPVIVHCITEKGHGYPEAEQSDERYHQVKATNAAPPGAGNWTNAFAGEMVALGAERPDIVAITAAMRRSTGLEPFAELFPDRFFDVGIAEQHAVASAAGLATAGLHPVVAVYGTFLTRAFDQLLMDVALHRCGVTFALDRSGVTGEDGASHNGVWDLAVLQVVPGLRMAAPRDAAQLRAQLREAVAVSDAPTVVRYPKGDAGAPIPAVDRVGDMDLLRRPDPAEQAEVLIVSVGGMAEVCCAVADQLTAGGHPTTVVDPRWVKPLDPALPGLAAGHRLVVTVEDGVRAGGVGAAVGQALADANVWRPVRSFGTPVAFLDHASRGQVLQHCGLTARDITDQVEATLTTLDRTDATVAMSG